VRDSAAIALIDVFFSSSPLHAYTLLHNLNFKSSFTACTTTGARGIARWTRADRREIALSTVINKPAFPAESC
jgi:hypothetical protein